MIDWQSVFPAVVVPVFAVTGFDRFRPSFALAILGAIAFEVFYVDVGFLRHTSALDWAMVILSNLLFATALAMDVARRIRHRRSGGPGR